MYTTATAQTSTITVHHDDIHQSKILIPGNNSMLGTQVEAENNSLEIYPNPANQNIEIRTTGNFTTYQLLDLSGRIISEGNLLNNSISVSTLDAGTYIVKLKDANGNWVQKICKRITTFITHKKKQPTSCFFLFFVIDLFKTHSPHSLLYISTHSFCLDEYAQKQIERQ